jgi:hypothetical protein
MYNSATGTFTDHESNFTNSLIKNNKIAARCKELGYAEMSSVDLADKMWDAHLRHMSDSE